MAGSKINCYLCIMLKSFFYISPLPPRRISPMRAALLSVLVVMLAGCEHVFDVHPYDMDLSGERNINATNIAKIKAACEGRDTVRFAVISDTHGNYSDLSDEVHDINRRDSVDFVIHLGDLTETGTTKVFMWARRELGKLTKPYFALIGNHDFLGTGDQAYEWMFGTKNFSFVLNGIKFIALDTNAMEYDHVAAVPDFTYMENQATADTTAFSRTIVLMHAPPYSDEFNNNVSKAFNYYVTLFPGVMFCLYGHNHNDTIVDIFDNGILYYGIDSAAHRNYHIFTLTPNGYAQQRIDY